MGSHGESFIIMKLRSLEYMLAMFKPYELADHLRSFVRCWFVVLETPPTITHRPPGQKGGEIDKILMAVT